MCIRDSSCGETDRRAVSGVGLGGPDERQAPGHADELCADDPGAATATSVVVDDLQAPSDRLAYSVPEAARLLGISRDLAYDLVASGTIGSVRLGRRLVVPRRALEDLLDRLSAESSGGPGGRW